MINAARRGIIENAQIVKSRQMKVPKNKSKSNRRMKYIQGKRFHNYNVSGEKENGLRGKSGDLGLSALANNSSPESELDVRARVAIDANPLLPSFACCCTWIDSGG